ncbi:MULTISPECIES: hypothetical protein [Paenibacillus]|uniref:hypothetical protein n=1 Tax=Paenibacillus TaxID=44249 RepID=UPI00333EBB07
MKPVKFSIIGGAGFRAQYYLRIAQAMPERFQVSGTVVRNETKALGRKRNGAYQPIGHWIRCCKARARILSSFP